MPEEPRLILTAPPKAAHDALAFGLPVGHMAYRVGSGAHLLRATIPLNLRGGLMVIDSTGFDNRGEVPPFCQQVIRECLARNYNGVILDFEGKPLPLLCKIVEQLGHLLSRRGWPLYTTEEYTPYSDQAKAIIPSALSGGSLSNRLSEAVKHFGADRVALGIQRTAEDFSLPSPSGSGTPLEKGELERRIAARGAYIFFSDDLCAYYFTYMSRQSGAHFVLYDNAESIRKKIQLAQNMKLCACLMAWPEIHDILGPILGRH